MAKSKSDISLNNLKAMLPHEGSPAEQVAALYLTIRSENHAAACVTGTSLKVFTLDKQIEREWDDTVRRYFKKLQIPCVEAN